MNHITAQNERTARSRAIIFAIGVHLCLGALLCLQMGKPSHEPVPVKANQSTQKPAAAAKTV